MNTDDGHLLAATISKDGMTLTLETHKHHKFQWTRAVQEEERVILQHKSMQEEESQHKHMVSVLKSSLVDDHGHITALRLA